MEQGRSRKSEVRSQKKRGRQPPPFSFNGPGGLPLLAALFLALGCFLRHVSCPSLHVVLSFAGLHCVAALLPTGTPTLRTQRPRFVANTHRHRGRVFDISSILPLGPSLQVVLHVLVVIAPKQKRCAHRSAAPLSRRAPASEPLVLTVSVFSLSVPNTWAESVALTQA